MGGQEMKALDWIATIIVVIAAIDIAVGALFGYTFLWQIFGSMQLLWQAVAVIIGLSGLVVLFMKFSKS